MFHIICECGKEVQVEVDTGIVAAMEELPRYRGCCECGLVYYVTVADESSEG